VNSPPASWRVFIGDFYKYSSKKQNKNMVWTLVSRGDKSFEVPQKKVLNSHDFYLIFTGDTKKSQENSDQAT